MFTHNGHKQPLKNQFQQQYFLLAHQNPHIITPIRVSNAHQCNNNSSPNQNSVWQFKYKLTTNRTLSSSVTAFMSMTWRCDN